MTPVSEDARIYIAAGMMFAYIENFDVKTLRVPVCYTARDLEQVSAWMVLVEIELHGEINCTKNIINRIDAIFYSIEQLFKSKIQHLALNYCFEQGYSKFWIARHKGEMKFLSGAHLFWSNVWTCILRTVLKSELFRGIFILSETIHVSKTKDFLCELSSSRSLLAETTCAISSSRFYLKRYLLWTSGGFVLKYNLFENILFQHLFRNVLIPQF